MTQKEEASIHTEGTHAQPGRWRRGEHAQPEEGVDAWGNHVGDVCEALGGGRGRGKELG